MNTTNLFVELVVIGSGVFTWLVLLVVAFVGIDPISFDQSTLLASAIPVLSIVYVFGIVWDRVADAVFGRLWGQTIRLSYFPELGEYYNARRIILTESSAFSDLLEYGRSRLRICRGWALNAPLIGISLDWLLIAQLEDGGPTLIYVTATTICAIALTFGAWFAWNNLTQAEYRKIKEQALFLKHRKTGS